MTSWDKAIVVAGLALILGCQHGDGDKSPEASLTQAQTDALLAPLPTIEREAGDRQNFVQRPDGPPAPDTDGNQQPAFPAQTGTAPSVEAEAPRILRHAPQGEVERAELISLSFSEPMVALDRHDSDVTPPIRLSPEVDGNWRWVDTRTLVFEPDAGRLPMATNFDVSVDAGMTSAAELSLSESYQWPFSTPPPKITQSAPAQSQPVSHRPVMVLAFNQPIDREKLLEHLRLTADGESHALTLASEEAIEQDRNGAKAFTESLETDHWIALTPKLPSDSRLPPDSRLTLTLPEGAFAREGNRPGTEQSLQFRTAGPLRIAEVECGYGGRCTPGREWTLRLSQGLSEDWSKETVDISPELPDAQFRYYGNRLSILGDARSNTEYTITLKAGTEDEFGQTLEEDISTRVTAVPHGPSARIPGWPNLVLSAEHDNHLPIVTRNLSELTVEIRRVDPQQWQAFTRAMEPAQGERQVELPGELIEKRTLTLEQKTDQHLTTRVSLEKALNESGTGHAIVSVRAPELEDDPNRPLHHGRPMNPLKGTWVQITRLGISQYQESDQQLAWVTDLASGTPLEGIHVEHSNAEATTGADGVARLPRDRNKQGPWLLARSQTDSAFISGLGFDREYREYTDTHGRYPLLTFFDRGIYRPGETVNVKGVLRELTPGTDGDIHWPKGITHVHWSAHDGQHNEMASGQEPLSDTASFDFQIPIPATAALGQGGVSIQLQMEDGEVTDTHWPESFQIQEFRRPEYRVTSAFDTDVAIHQEPLKVELQASYYSGSPLPAAPLEWTVQWRTGHYSPPGWPEYRFGKTPEYRPFYHHHPSAPEGEASFRATTDASGQHSLPLIPNDQLKREPTAYPLNLVAIGEVTDINRQRWSSQSEILLHPANAYVGIKPASRFVTQGDAIEITLATVDIDGQASSGNAVEVKAEHMEWHNGDWQARHSQQCTFTSGSEPRPCSFDTERSGQYRITAEVRDSQGRPSKTQLNLWVSGGAATPPMQPEATPQVQLVADKDIYHPGDTAQIKVEAPFYPAHALITLHRQGILESRQVSLDESGHLLEVPITGTMIPGFSVSVEAVGAIDESTRAVSPGQAMGTLNIDVSSESRTLQVDVALDKNRLQPGDNARAQIQVTDYQNNPIDHGELTLYAVDESLLDLTGYALPDGKQAFYGYIDRSVNGDRLRDNLMLTPSEVSEAMLEEIVAGERASLGMAAPSSDSSSPQVLRSNFDPLAVFKATLLLDENGQSTVDFELPDSLTRYRVMAFVHTEQQFGSGQAELEVNLPLMVRPSAPRFLNLGDRAELPVVLHNTTDKPLTVDVALRASNLTLKDPAGKRVTVPANDRKELRFDVQPQHAGTARLQVVAQAGEWRDATELTLPVLTPATREAFAQYGSLTEGAHAYPLEKPKDVYPDFGGLEISTSSTQLHSLSDAFRYLVQYPYGSSEQLASRLMSIVALGPMADLFAGEDMPTEAELDERVDELLAQLQKRQNRDGGWSFWRRGGTSQAYVSVHVTHTLLRAREAGHSLPDNLLRPAIDYLAGLEQTLDEAWDSRQRQALLAYRLYVQKLAGTLEPTAPTALFDRLELDDTSMETLGWLLAVTAPDNSAHEAMRREILRRLNNSVRETAAGAQFVDDYPKGGHRVLHGSRRTDAVVLEALLNTQPDHELIEKTARGLLNQRQQGRWGNTQENVFVLQALKTYIQTRESDQPDMVARAWLGSLFLGDQRFEGRSTEGQSLNVPMAELQQQTDPSPLTLQTEGQGRLYYRLGMRYAPEDLLLDPAAHGIRVEREYQALQDENDVQQTDDGRWQIRAGAAVRVKLTITLPARRHHLALTDYLPAGLEALNPELEGTADAGRSERTRWPSHWYNHQQLRDERVEVFATQLEAGVYHFEYNALATTPGTFIAPPAKAEEQYQPETFGRTATHRVEIVADH